MMTPEQMTEFPMRKLLTATIAAVALATAFVGSASADTYYGDLPHVNNLALQNQLERDATSRRLRRAPLGVVISPGDDTPSAASMPNSTSSHASTPSAEQNTGG